MLIICIKSNENGQHLFESQSHRTECWMDGYIAVPSELERVVFDCFGYCDLVIEDGLLVNVEPHPERIPEQVVS